MKPYQVEIQIHPTVRNISHKKLQQDSQAILKALGWSKAALSLLLTDDSGIRPIHKHYLGDDTPTDVISFCHFEGEGPVPDWNGLPFLGDLVISVETARREALRHGHSLWYEICFYVCHGLLHFEGFEDHTPARRRRMFRIQEAVLEAAGISKK